MIYRPKIAIIIPTIMRDSLLMEVINSLTSYLDWDYFKVFIVEQNPEVSYSAEKKIFYETACSQFHNPLEQRIQVIKVGKSVGLSACRNMAVAQAMSEGIPYCLISADSIQIANSFKDIKKLIPYFDKYDLIGLNLRDRIRWEGKLTLIPNSHFELEYIDFNKEWDTYIIETSYDEIDNFPIFNTIGGIWDCDIVRNFFLARTETLHKVKWDENLVMHEHEDYFIRYKEAKYKVGCTDIVEGIYIGETSKSRGDYAMLRKTNMADGRKTLFAKYNLKSWIKYKNKPC